MTSIVVMMKENRMRLFGYVMGREKSEAIRTVVQMKIEGKRERG